MGKIYVVTSGKYSDYRINIVTTNKEIAELYCKNHSYEYLDFECKIEEFEDYNDISTEQESFNNKEIAYSYYFYGYNYDVHVDKIYEDKSQSSRIIYIDENSNFSAHIIVHCDEEEKAFKIACDMRAKKISELMGL